MSLYNRIADIFTVFVVFPVIIPDLGLGLGLGLSGRQSLHGFSRRLWRYGSCLLSQYWSRWFMTCICGMFCKRISSVSGKVFTQSQSNYFALTLARRKAIQPQSVPQVIPGNEI